MIKAYSFGSEQTNRVCIWNKLTYVLNILSNIAISSGFDDDDDDIELSSV